MVGVIYSSGDGSGDGSGYGSGDGGSHEDRRTGEGGVMGYSIERRDGYSILTDRIGGCRPATPAEKQFFGEIERLRAELAKANALLLTYGRHRDECAFLEVCDDCDCGFEAILRKALTINKAARKGEGE